MAALTVFAIPDIHVLNPSIVLSEHDGLLMDWNRIAFPNADWQYAASCVRSARINLGIVVGRLPVDAGPVCGLISCSHFI